MDGAFEDAYNWRKKLTSYHSDKYKYHEMNQFAHSDCSANFLSGS